MSSREGNGLEILLRSAIGQGQLLPLRSFIYNPLLHGPSVQLCIASWVLHPQVLCLIVGVFYMYM